MKNILMRIEKNTIQHENIRFFNEYPHSRGIYFKPKGETTGRMTALPLSSQKYNTSLFNYRTVIFTTTRSLGVGWSLGSVRDKRCIRRRSNGLF